MERAAAPVKARADAAAAARCLYERYSQRIFTFCVSRLRDAEEAQDATQTTFIYALRALDKGVEPRFELAWLLAIAQNVCRSTRRTLNRQGERRSYVDVTELEAAAESINGETGEDLAWLRGALGRLPENQRRAILLREWQGLSYADIADELHLSVAAVEALLFRARRSLTAQLERAKSGLKMVEPGTLALLLRGTREGATLKAAVAGVGLVIAVGPLAGAKLLHDPAKARAAAQTAPAHSPPAGVRPVTAQGSLRSSRGRGSAIAANGRRAALAPSRSPRGAPSSASSAPSPVRPSGTQPAGSSLSVSPPEVPLGTEAIQQVLPRAPAMPPIPPAVGEVASALPNLSG